MSDDWRIKLVCTDRGQHRKVTFTYYLPRGGGLMVGARKGPNDPPGPGGRIRVIGDWATLGWAFLGWQGRRGPIVYDLGKCPKCGRHTQISNEKLLPVGLALADAGIAELDISRLPF